MVPAGHPAPPAAPRRPGLQRAANGNITLDFPSATNRSYQIACGSTPGSFAQAAVLPGTGRNLTWTDHGTATKPPQAIAARRFYPEKDADGPPPERSGDSRRQMARI